VGKIGGDHASALGLGLNHDCGVGQTSYDTVANQEMFAIKSFRYCKLRNKGSVLFDFLGVLFMLRWIAMIQTVGQTGNRGHPRSQGLIVGDDVYATGKTRNDHWIQCLQSRNELPA